MTHYPHFDSATRDFMHVQWRPFDHTFGGAAFRQLTQFKFGFLKRAETAHPRRMQINLNLHVKRDISQISFHELSTPL